ncbi:MAG: hypothetical protein GY943_10860, partial [Chloroflexi bacterium]|nr:hypothetical protein [Chloroflexota bacterium]
SDVIIIVDVLSFSTSVDIAVGNGATVLPYLGSLAALPAFAKAKNAIVAQHGRSQTSGSGYSLSPASLVTIPAGTRLVLPSPNGSTLSLSTGDTPTIAGCLRNARAVAENARKLGKQISVIAAGERWKGGLLRPSIEDLIGAGAILSYLEGNRSPEGETAVATYHHAHPNLKSTILRCSSGKELVGRGFSEDLQLATQLNLSNTVPLLVDGEYENYKS